MCRSAKCFRTCAKARDSEPTTYSCKRSYIINEKYKTGWRKLVRQRRTLSLAHGDTGIYVADCSGNRMRGEGGGVGLEENGGSCVTTFSSRQR